MKGEREDSLSSDYGMIGITEWRLWDASDLENWKVKPLEWLVDPLIPKGSVGFMSGQPKVGKSLLALDLCLHIVHSYLEQAEWLGTYECHPAKILYIAREDPARRIKERAVEFMGAYGWDFVLSDHLNFLVRERFNLLDPNHIAWLSQLPIEDERENLLRGVDDLRKCRVSGKGDQSE